MENKGGKSSLRFFSGAAEKKFSTNEPHQILKTTSVARWGRGVVLALTIARVTETNIQVGFFRINELT